MDRSLELESQVFEMSGVPLLSEKSATAMHRPLKRSSSPMRGLVPGAVSITQNESLKPSHRVRVRRCPAASLSVMHSGIEVPTVDLSWMSNSAAPLMSSATNTNLHCWLGLLLQCHTHSCVPTEWLPLGSSTHNVLLRLWSNAENISFQSVLGATTARAVPAAAVLSPTARAPADSSMAIRRINIGLLLIAGSPP